MKSTLTVSGLLASLLVFLPAVRPAVAADPAAIQKEIEAVRKAMAERKSDQRPVDLETYVRDTGTRNYYQREFYTALTNGNATALAVVFKEFPEFAQPQFLNGYVQAGKSALHYAAEQGHREVVALLLAQKVGADAPRPVTPSPFGPGGPFGPRVMLPPGYQERRDTPLHLAVRAGNVEVIKLLLEAGANLEALDSRSESALYVCVRVLGGPNYGTSGLPAGSESRQQMEATLRVLLERGAQLFTTNRAAFGYQPLSVILQSRNDALLDMVLTNCVHRAQTNEGGNTLVHFAVGHGRTNALRVLLQHQPPLEVANTFGQTPLRQTAWMRATPSLPAPTYYASGYAVDSSTRAAFLRQRSADLLLAAGAKPDALVFAGLNRTNELAALLQREPTQVEVRDAAGRAPLHYALNAGSTAAWHLLLAAKADVNARDSSGKTPLFQALEQGAYTAVSNLLAAGASVTLTNGAGQTVLHTAVMLGGHTNLLAALVTAGADLHARDVQGKTPLDLAAVHRRFDLVPWFEERGARLALLGERLMTTPLHQAVAQGRPPEILNLLTNGADVNARNEQGHTPLALAVQAGRADLTLLLLTNQANPNVADTNGITPLRARFHTAQDTIPDPVPKPGFVKRPAPSLQPKGIATRVDILPPDLLPVARTSHPFDNNMLLLLLEHGADPRLPDNKGLTILHTLPGAPPEYSSSAQSRAALIPQAVARIRLLSNYGLKPDTRATNGVTPLQMMVRQANLMQAFALIEAGADVSLADREGRNALHYALTPQLKQPKWQYDGALREGVPRTLALLLNNGADLRRADANGDTPVHLLPAMDDGLRTLLLPVLKTNRHFTAAAQVKNKSGNTLAQLAFGQLRGRVTGSVVQLVTALLDAGVKVPAPVEGAATTLLHELASLVDQGGQPNFGFMPSAPEGPPSFARMISNIVAQAGNVNIRNAQRETPLHAATRAENATFAALLLARRADPNAQDSAGDTPLHLAIRNTKRHVFAHGINPIIPLLLSNRCDLVRFNQAGETPLRMDLARVDQWSPVLLPPGASNGLLQAANLGDLGSLEAFLAVDPTLPTFPPCGSALRMAAIAGRTEFAERLKLAGANEPVSAALLGWTNELAAFVREDPRLGAQYVGAGVPLFHVAIARGQLASARLLLTSELSPSQVDSHGRSALYHAATNRQTGFAAELATRGVRHTAYDAIALEDQTRLAAVLAADPAAANATNVFGLTPLLAAVRHGKLELVRDLLAAGANPDQPAGTTSFSGGLLTPVPGAVALHLAAWSNRVDLAELLFKSKANVNHFNTHNLSALHYAAGRGNVEFAALLLAHGADPNLAKSNSGPPPAAFSPGSAQRPSVFPTSVNAGAAPLHLAVRFGHSAMVELLVAKGARLEATDDRGRTPAGYLQRDGMSPSAPVPPWPYLGFPQGLPMMDVQMNPSRAPEVTATLRKLGAIIPAASSPRFPGFPAPGFPGPSGPTVPPGFPLPSVPPPPAPQR